MIARFEEEVKKVHGVVSRVSGHGELSSSAGRSDRGEGNTQNSEVGHAHPSRTRQTPLWQAGAEVTPINLGESEILPNGPKERPCRGRYGADGSGFCSGGHWITGVQGIGAAEQAGIRDPSHARSHRHSRQDCLLFAGSVCPCSIHADGLPSAVSLVTGPSRTADIETIRTVGIHGPIELHVVILENV